jgi:hypothetical protein
MSSEQVTAFEKRRVKKKFFFLGSPIILVPILYFILYTLYFILYTLYFILYTSYFLLYTLYFILSFLRELGGWGAPFRIIYC